MKKLMKIALVSLVIVAVIGVSVSIDSSAFISTYLTGVTATPNHADKSIKVTWSHSETDYSYIVKYRPEGGATYTEATGEKHWTLNNAVPDKTYYFDVAATKDGNTGAFYSTSGVVRVLPSATGASFDESTNTIRFSTNVGLNSVKYSDVCMMSVDKNDHYHARCGSSGSQSGDYQNVVISGEISNDVSITGQYFLARSGALESKHSIKSVGDQEIYHGVRTSAMSVTGASFSESSNMITLTTSVLAKYVKGGDVCVVSVDNNDHYHWRCGGGVSYGSSTTSVAVDGELQSGLQYPTTYIHVKAESIQSIEGVYNSASQELYGVLAD